MNGLGILGNYNAVVNIQQKNCIFSIKKNMVSLAIVQNLWNSNLPSMSQTSLHHLALIHRDIFKDL